MKGKIITGLAAVTLIFSGAAAAPGSFGFAGTAIVANAEVVTIGSTQYKDLSDGTYELMGYTGEDETFTVTSNIDNGNVSSIGSFSFSDNTAIAHVVIEDGISNIGAYAFRGCTALKSITIPESVTTIGEGAFDGVDDLTISCYEGSVAEEFAKQYDIKYVTIVKVEEVSIKDTEIALEKTSYDYTGKAITPAVTVTYDGATLTEGEDYTLSYINNDIAGTGSVIVYGAGRFTGSTPVDFTINKLNMKNATVKGIKKSYTFTGSAIKPKITSVKVGSLTLKEGTDYSVSYKSNTKAGTATVKLTGERSFKGTYSKTFTIAKKSLAKAKVTGIKKSYQYTTKAIKPVPTKLTVSGNTLKKGTDYTISYKNNKKLGTATLTIKGKGNYKGSLSKTFKIAKRNVKTAKITGVSKRYKVTGKAIKPKVKTVKIGKVTLKKGRDYTVSYKNNKAAGTASVIIKGKGNYTGKYTKTFKILSKEQYKLWQYTKQVVKLVNKERSSRGIKELTLDETLYDKAMIRSNELTKNLSHFRPDGTECFTVLDGIRYYYAGENIAAGQQTPEQVVKSWMDSEGHRANILSTNFKKIGVGLIYSSGSTYGYYWTQLFTG
ncbi:MAG: leucine-rich repeat protein [Ruminococcus sp.]|nr:leucine-rich repeat protein [Ruminococcus sp.]